jgi:hypothetical protein
VALKDDEDGEDEEFDNSNDEDEDDDESLDGLNIDKGKLGPGCLNSCCHDVSI